MHRAIPFMVSNHQGASPMRTTPYRTLLPIVQTVSAIAFGGIGLWQRHVILNRPFWGDQTLWDSTARFHVWPVPYKFAVVSNFPAYMAAGLIEWSLSTIWRPMPETVGFVLFMALVPVLWYFVGRRLDSGPSNSQSQKLLLAFGVFALAGIFTPGYAGYRVAGFLLWIIFGMVVARARRLPNG